MPVKCSYCDVTLRTITSVILWLDVVICTFTLFAVVTHTQEEECLEGSKDCSVHFQCCAILILNICFTIMGLYGVRQNKPTLLLPYIICKFLLLLLITVTVLIISRNHSVKPIWIPPTDFNNAMVYSIIFALQLYLIFMATWSYIKMRRVLSACSKKYFKSVISIWIGDSSHLNTSDSTCIIETKT